MRCWPSVSVVDAVSAERPFPALAGAVVGRPMAGAMIGVVLEAFHLSVLPVGAARFPGRWGVGRR